MPERLDGWKAIADHLGRDPRTAQRWCRERGMPVRHTPGGLHGTVFAYATELDEWLASGGPASLPTRPAPDSSLEAAAMRHPEPRALEFSGPAGTRGRLVVGVVFGGAILLSIAGWVLSISSPRLDARPVRAELHGDLLSAFGPANDRLWTFELPQTRALQQAGLQAVLEQVLVADIDDDAEREVIAAVNHADHRGGIVQDAEVLCLSTRGNLRWSYRPHGSLTFNGRQFSGPWRVAGAAVARKPAPGVWVALIDRVWWPSFVAHVGADGRQRLALVNSGHIQALLEVNTGRGPMLLAGGFNNEFMLPALAAFDAHGPAVASPQTHGTAFFCNDCPEARPGSYLLFPRSDVNMALDRPFSFVGEIATPDHQGFLEVSVRDSQHAGRAVYRVNRDLQPVSVGFSDAYWETHRQLTAQGRLDHAPEDCPERLHGVVVRVWQPAGGWTDVRVRPTF